jgi:hypothetical protein
MMLRNVVTKPRDRAVPALSLEDLAKRGRPRATLVI